MIHIVLVEPEIPQNTGNISRTCAIIGARLHLVRPLGFDISEKAVKRAGLDYWQYLDLQVHNSIDDFLALYGDRPLWLATTKGGVRYTDAVYEDDCYLLFGKESAGLPQWLRERYAERCVRIPMKAEVRSLNLGNSVAIMAYEALRQRDFAGLKG